MSLAPVLEHSSLAAAQARVAQVQQRIALLAGPSPTARGAAALAPALVPATGPSAGSPLAAGSSSAFAEALAQATGLPAAGAGPDVGAGAPALAGGGVLEASYLRPAVLRAAPPAGAAAHQHLFDAATARHGLPAGLLSAVARVESGYDAGAVSPAGARGLMQIMPGTARDLGVDPMVPAQAVDGAARLLAQHLETFGSLPLALAAYNAGAGNVRKHGGVPPFAETRAYVEKVAAAQAATAAPSQTRSA